MKKQTTLLSVPSKMTQLTLALSTLWVIGSGTSLHYARVSQICAYTYGKHTASHDRVAMPMRSCCPRQVQLLGGNFAFASALDVVVVFLEMCAIVSRDVFSNMLSQDVISQKKSDRVIRAYGYKYFWEVSASPGA
ncbi:hypothetical protein E2C01_031467 [Portunus trituberculatus]|uniref:Uncharacterized protein n=1 Tax=Portunus trituberculatus TaxID=210409 RepID=A0A5B7ESV6_PORTR|nr:hypothetical protein [Portunus trituberculatus]